MLKITNTIATLLCLMTLIVGCSDQSTNKASAFVERSDAYARQGQYRAALIEMRNAIQANPEDITYIIQYAELLTTVGSPNQAEEVLKAEKSQIDAIRLPMSEALLLQGKFISAVDLLKDWKQNPTEQTEFERLSALQQYLAGDQNSAFKAYRKLAGDPNTDMTIRHEFISLLLQNGDIKEAQQWVSQLLSENAEDPVLLYYNARLAYSANNLEDAEKDLTEALFHLPETDMLLNNRLQVLELLSNVLTELGRSTEALAYSKIIHAANPDAFLAKQQYKDALAAAGAGDLTSAKAAFEDILNQFPNNQQAALLLGLIHLEEGQIDSAEALLSENLDAETAPVTIIQATALAQAEQGKPEEALAVLERALLARPDDTTLLSLYGVISLNNNQAQQGIQSISKALQLDPNKTRLHLLLAQYYVDQDQAGMALGHLRKAYAQKASDWPTTGFYLSLLVDQDEKNEAIKVRNRIATDFAADTSALWLVAMTDYQLGNTQSSISELEKLHKKVPDNLNIINALAKLYQQAEKIELAAGMWLKALEVNPGDTNFIQSLLVSKSKTLSTTDLTNWLIQQAKQNPEVALPLHSAAVEMLVNQRRVDEALQLGESYRNNEQPLARAIRANILRGEAFLLAEKGEWKKSLKKVNSALVALPDNTGLTILASQIDVRLENYPGAIASLEKLLEKQPNNLRVIDEKVKLIALSESPENALEFVKPIWKKQASGLLAQTYFGLINRLEPDNLESSLNELLVNEPGNAGALTTLAGLNMAKGKTDLAIGQYEKALTSNPNMVPALNNLAWLLRESQPDNSLGYAKKAAELAPNSASVLDTYGWILHLNGKNGEALKIIDEALKLEPENQEILEHKKEITG